MRYKLLGKSGLRVSELCLGTMTFGEEWGYGASKDVSRIIFDSFIEKGGNFFDTANRYTNGTSERFLGEFIASERDRFVISTKYSLFTRAADPNSSGNHRKNLVQALEGSLKRLNTDYIDLYILHAWDGVTPIEEVMRALDDLIKSGKILYIGVSDTPAWVIARANTIAEFMGWTQFVNLQVEYSLVERTPERDLLPMARELGIGVTAWSPLGGGVLTGKYNADSSLRSARPAGYTSSDASVAELVLQLSRETGYSPASIALNWLRQQTNKIIPIVGARTLAQINENLACLEFELDMGMMQHLTEATAVQLGFPHELLNSDRVQQLLFSEIPHLIDKSQT